MSELNGAFQKFQTLFDELQRASVGLKEALNNERQELDKQKEAFQQMTKKLDDFHIKNKVVLDIGGTRYATSLENLQKVKGIWFVLHFNKPSDSFFSAMFSGTWKLNPESDGSYFIDRDGTNFRYILNYLRNGELSIPKDEYLIQEILKEAEFYQITPLIEELQNLLYPSPAHAIPIDSVLLTTEYINTLQSWIGGQFTWNLLYRATRDSFTTEIFHNMCDNKGPTVSIIRDTQNSIFGGYTTASWRHSYQNDSNAFIFTLNNPHNIPPTKFHCKNPATAIYCDSNNGPAFGKSDLTICTQSNVKNNSYIRFPDSYLDTIGKGKTLFVGQEWFTTSEIEIFEIKYK